MRHVEDKPLGGVTVKYVYRDSKRSMCRNHSGVTKLVVTGIKYQKQ